MNWTEFFTAFAGAANAFAGAVAIIIAALAAALIRIQNSKLTKIQAEAKDAKEHAASTAEKVQESRDERSLQFETLSRDAKDAYSHANNTNDKIARQNLEILALRRQFAELTKSLTTPASPVVPPPNPDTTPTP